MDPNENKFMEFNEKLRNLRNASGLTQEELAEKLYVSRTAISKWESGRGYPNIDSLKQIAQFFSVSLDELIADKTNLTEKSRKKERRFYPEDLAIGLIDCSAVTFLFLPLFAQRENGSVTAVSLLFLTSVSPYIIAVLFASIAALTLSGISILSFQSCKKSLWLSVKYKISLCSGIFALLLFTVSLQPYAAVVALILILLNTGMSLIVFWGIESVAIPI